MSAPLTDRAVALMVKQYAERAGLDPARFAGHSLRAGYVTSAVEANAPLMKIVEQTRHKSVDLVRVYSRRIDLFRDHSGAAFLRPTAESEATLLGPHRPSSVVCCLPCVSLLPA